MYERPSRVPRATHSRFSTQQILKLMVGSPRRLSKHLHKVKFVFETNCLFCLSVCTYRLFNSLPSLNTILHYGGFLETVVIRMTLSSEKHLYRRILIWYPLISIRAISISGKTQIKSDLPVPFANHS
jgi:hypothetical protein